MSQLNVGIVGLGWVAGAHIATFNKIPGAKVTAVCSRRELDEAAISAQYGTPLKAYRDYEAMLARVHGHPFVTAGQDADTFAIFFTSGTPRFRLKR